MIFSYGLIYGIGVCAGWELSEIHLLLLAVLQFGISYGRRYLIERRIPADACRILLTLGILFGVIFNETGREYLWNCFAYYGEWQFMGSLNMQYGWIWVYLLLILGAGIYHKVSEHAEMKILLSGVILAFLIWQAWMEWEWKLLPAAALIFICLDGMIAGYRRFVAKQKETGTKDILPFLVLTVLLISVLPVRKEPVSWDGVRQIWDEMKESANELLARMVYGGGGSEFGVGTAGFSEDDGNFWGRLTDGRKREMLKISVYTGAGTEDKYFTGVVKERYEEETWYAGDTETDEIELSQTESVNTDLWERLYYLHCAGIESKEDVRFCQSHTYEFRYENLNTRVGFYPANFYRIRPKDDETQIYREGNNLVFDHKQSRGDSYEVSGLSMNLKHEELVGYLREVTAEESYEDVMELLGSYAGATGKDTLFAECVKRLGYSEEEIAEFTDGKWKPFFEERATRIRERNLQLPENISEEIKELAVELTKDYTNDYDKVQAISRYLKKDGGFTYSTVPTELPEGENVMDYFLFESREGYCTYYATAFTLLCRLADIPARYVEGIAPDYKEEQEGWYSVWGGDSHAWTQVYFAGFGWMDVDATPGREVSSGDWKNAAATYEQRGEAGGEALWQDVAETEQDTESAAGITIFRERAGDIVIWLCAISGGLLVVILVTKVVTRMTFLRATRRRQAEILMHRLLHTLKMRGLKIRPDETLRMYQKRLVEEDAELEIYASVFRWYEGVRYGEEEVTAEDIRKLEQLYEAERKRTRRIRWQKRLHHKNRHHKNIHQ